MYCVENVFTFVDEEMSFSVIQLSSSDQAQLRHRKRPICTAQKK